MNEEKITNKQKTSSHNMSKLHKVRIVPGDPQVWIGGESLGTQCHRWPATRPAPSVLHKHREVHRQGFPPRLICSVGALALLTLQQVYELETPNSVEPQISGLSQRQSSFPSRSGHRTFPEEALPQSHLGGKLSLNNTRKVHLAHKKALRLDATAYVRANFRHFWDGSMVR